MESKLISSLVFVLMLAFAIEAKKRKGYTGGEVKPGHYSIKEFHFHIYFRRNFEAEGQLTLPFSALVLIISCLHEW